MSCTYGKFQFDRQNIVYYFIFYKYNIEYEKQGKMFTLIESLIHKIIVTLYHPFSFTNVNSLQLFVIKM